MLFAERPAVIDRRLDVLRTGTVAGLFVIQVLLFLVGLSSIRHLEKQLREAAKKAHFNSVSGLNNQTGTITYYFKLK